MVISTGIPMSAQQRHDLGPLTLALAVYNPCHDNQASLSISILGLLALYHVLKTAGFTTLA